jgi:NADH:ubiquinone oxidoreductase subunit K
MTLPAYMLEGYLYVVALLFILGVWGVAILRKNLLMFLVCVEMILLSMTLLVLLGSALFDDMQGQIVSIFVLMLAASESAIGLAIIVAYYRLARNVDLRYVSNIRE